MTQQRGGKKRPIPLLENRKWCGGPEISVHQLLASKGTKYREEFQVKTKINNYVFITAWSA